MEPKQQEAKAPEDPIKAEKKAAKAAAKAEKIAKAKAKQEKAPAAAAAKPDEVRILQVLLLSKLKQLISLFVTEKGHSTQEGVC